MAAKLKSPPPPASLAETRERLLAAAAEVFALHGFRRGTVREICQRAGANVAAVNYHFGDKEKLYAAVLRHYVQLALAKYPPDMGVGPNPSPQDKLRGFVRGFLFRMLDEGDAAWHGRLIAQEMIEPTAALGLVLNESIRPMALRLGGILRELLGPAATDDLIGRCSASIVGQCVFYRNADPVLSKLFPRRSQTRSPAEIEALARHVTEFSLDGLLGLRAAPAERRAREGPTP